MFTKHSPFPSGIQYQLLPDEAKRVCQIVRSKYAYGHIDVAGIALAVYTGANPTTDRLSTTQSDPVFFDNVDGDVAKVMSTIQSSIAAAIDELVSKGVDRSAIKVSLGHNDQYEPDLRIYLKYRSIETDEQYTERLEKMCLYELMLDKVLPASLELAKACKSTKDE